MKPVAYACVVAAVACVFSTPLGMQGKFFEFYTNPSFAAMQLPSSINRYLSADFLEAEKLRMDSDAYAREYWPAIQSVPRL